MINQIQILNVAKQLISYYGPQKTTMKDIAERLSVSPPYLLKFFEDKGALVLAFVKLVNQDLYEEVRRRGFMGIDLSEILNMVLQLKMKQFKKYFRVVQSLSYLDRLGNLELVRQDYEDNNRKIAALITEYAGKVPSAESSNFTRLLLDLLQRADHLAEGYITKYVPTGRVESTSFKPLFQELLTLKNNFIERMDKHEKDI